MSHRHVRICINGIKVRSTGGQSAARLKAYDHIGQIPFDEIPELRAFQDKHVELTLVFIRRHHKRTVRTISYISRYVWFRGWLYGRSEYSFGLGGLTLTADSLCYTTIHTLSDHVLRALTTTPMSQCRTYDYFKYHSLPTNYSVSMTSTDHLVLVPDFMHLYPKLTISMPIGGATKHEPSKVVQAERTDHSNVQFMQPGKVSGTTDRPHDPADGTAAC